MNIELLIEGEKKVFTTPFVPAMFKRKFTQIRAEAEEKVEKGTYSTRDQYEEDQEINALFASIVFAGQFTVDEMLYGASEEYITEKTSEALFGKAETSEDDEGNEQGE